MKLHLVAIVAGFLASPAWSQMTLADYLPEDVTYDPAIPKPSDVLGWEVGTWHVRHDQLVRYFEVLAEASDRMTLDSYGETHEERRLLLATVSAPEHHGRMDEIRQQHLKCVLDGEAHVPTAERPVITWMGYGVHGNEASAANCSLLTAYHLCAAQGEQIETILRHSVILIDPCINPDGNARFAQWVNMHKSVVLHGDAAHREHREVWPGGRTNHYWFDLNRDWLLLTHPESRGRVTKFHAWRPNLLTDYHEMGTGSSYFFQPGIPTRQNPWTPAANLHLTRKIAHYHARELDRIGSQYYTEESFDDFYYGKGSTYPDAHGCIGILFEQASSRGHLQENSWGELSFGFTIRNQFRTSLSSIFGACDIRDELLEYQMRCTRTALEKAENDTDRAVVFGDAHDPERTAALVDRLRRHAITVHALVQDVEVGGATFTAGSSYVVPLRQAQYRLVKSLFDTSTSWGDNTFYDVSAWNFGYCFGVPWAPMAAEGFPQDAVGPELEASPQHTGELRVGEDAVAALFEWDAYSAPRAVSRLLRAGVRVRVATRPIQVLTADAGNREFTYGTLIVPFGTQDVSPDELMALLQTIASEDGIDVFGTATGLTVGGPDLGSPTISSLTEPKVLVLVADGASSYEAGEVWHLLDTRYDVEVTLSEGERFGGLDMTRYTHVVAVQGASGALDESDTDELRAWVRGGGVLIATKGSSGWAGREILGRSATSSEEGDEAEEEESPDASSRPSYAEYDGLRSLHRVSGTIFEAEIDVTHPMGFGYRRDRLAVFKNSSGGLELDEDPFANVVRYTEEPLLAGYASDKAVGRIAGKAAVIASRSGRGVVVRMADNPNFRGVWYGTNKLFANALFFAKAIKGTGPLSEEANGAFEEE